MKIQSCFLLFILLSCCKDKIENPSQYWGNCSLDLNEVPSEFSPYCIPSGDLVNIYFDGLNENGFLRYELIFGLIQTKEYIIDSLYAYKTIGINEFEYSIFYTFLSDGDVVGNIYKLIDSSENYIEITSWDEEKGEFRGKFQTNFIIDTNYPINDINAPDTIRISNGEFYTRL